MPSLDRRSRELEVLRLTRQGHSVDEIVELTGFGESFVKEAPGKVLRATRSEEVEIYRMLQNDRLNNLLKSWWDSAKDDIDAANYVLKLLQEQSKLNGVYKQQQQEMQVSPTEFFKKLDNVIEFEVERRLRQKNIIEVQPLEVEEA